MEANKKSNLLIMAAAVLSAILAVLAKDGIESTMQGATGVGVWIYRFITMIGVGLLIGYLFGLANK